MGWVTDKKGRTYFYLSVRSGNRVRGKYLGYGIRAWREALRIEKKQQTLAQIRAEEALVADLEAATDELARRTLVAVHWLMLHIGFTNERSRGWRRGGRIVR